MTRLNLSNAGARLDDAAARDLVAFDDVPALMAASAALRDAGHGDLISYSKKVFIPLTKLCRDVCHYCTFAGVAQPGKAAFLTATEILAIAQAGAAAGCHEALFTLGDKPELRWPSARAELDRLGFPSTLAYLRAMAALVFRETGLLPHLNPGVMTPNELAMLRPVSASMGIMLETASPRLSQRGGPHYGSPDKDPALRLATIHDAGSAAIPFTSGILIGIGETRLERVEALLALRCAHERHGHLQEVIIQNFLPKPGTKMAAFPPASEAEHLWTIAVARLILGACANIQAPPNLSPGRLANLIGAGINDFGGISPITPDYVNPEAPWPSLDGLAEATAAAGKWLVERLPIYPAWARDPRKWLDPALHAAVYRKMDTAGLARDDKWQAGISTTPPPRPRLTQRGPTQGAASWQPLIDRAMRGDALSEADIVALFNARGSALDAVCAAANAVRQEDAGETITYVVTRNINYTNVCTFGCKFCAFSKGKTHADLRGPAYDLDLSEIARRAEEAWSRGATEVCLQGGIHPAYTGETYLAILRAVQNAAPGLHIHAFSPLEVTHGATTLGLSLDDYLLRLRDAGLRSLPGTAAEILDDEVRATLCPDKINTAGWFAVMRAAHRAGLRSTATIMFGHMETAQHWARHLLRLRAHQRETAGFTEFVPLPFVAQEAPIYRRGRARPGPTWREAILMHAVSRLVLRGAFTNVQASWVKLGPQGAAACLNAGANDLGGTLMNESITRAAGATHGQEMPPASMEHLITSLGRKAQQRTTLYGQAPPAQQAASYTASDLQPWQNTPLRRGAVWS